jgi:hypothetical protein
MTVGEPNGNYVLGNVNRLDYMVCTMWWILTAMHFSVDFGNTSSIQFSEGKGTMFRIHDRHNVHNTKVSLAEYMIKTSN